ncbi:GAF and ANTAR domain-containing protein [Amycolatopsis pigmentata]|uniref:GAF and ANTAR domain-containing protein n=1 Tax=Amycolatopsis pigmentata TaxID=450801 RepID=A0ABW5FYY3_9PSEU
MTTPVPSREVELAVAFTDIADTMVDDYDVVDLLHRVAAYCVRLLDVSAAGILLADGHGGLRLLASSNEKARLVELFQLQNEQDGPCLECYRTGQAVTAVGLSRWSSRWPGFADEALGQGFRTVHALPMRLREQTIGGLNLFRSEATSLSHGDLKLGQALADNATIAILQRRARARSETLIEQLQGALNSRITIEQAKGVLSSLGDIGVDEAFEKLHGFARHHNLLLTELARRVVMDSVEARRVLAFRRTPSA